MERVYSYNPGARTGLERKAPTYRHPKSVLERLGLYYRSTNVYTNTCASNDQCHTTHTHTLTYIYIYIDKHHRSPSQTLHRNIL